MTCLKKAIFPDTNYVENTYDLAGRKTATRDPRGNSTTYGYDNAYRLTSVTDPLNHARTFGYDLMSNLTSQTDALGNVTNFEYDDFDRLKKVIYPAATSGATRLEESITYDKLGNVKTRIDTAGRTTSYDYDTSNRLTKITDALTNQTQFEYNLRSQLTKVKDALNQEYVFTYDPLGRTLSQTRAGTTMSFEYDAVGNRTKRTDYAGRVTNYEYDDLSRLTKTTYASGSSNPALDSVATYTYDDLSRLLTAANNVGTVTLTYDNRGRLKTETDVWGKVVEYGYDAGSNRTLMKLDGANYSSYAYDNANRLTGITNAADNALTTYGYDNADRLTSRVFPNGVTTTYDYDGMSRLKRLKDINASAALFDRQYAYNAANQISQIAEPTQTKNFSYDNLSRLTGMTDGTLSENYAFDAVGNRTSSHLSSTYTYDPFNRLKTSQTSSQITDANGNMATRTDGPKLWTYFYDYENRMTRAADRRQNVTYRYDALGRRVERNRQYGLERSRFTHDGDDVLVEDVNGAAVKYQNGPGIDNKLSVKQGSTTNYFLADHLGSTNALTDATGAITASQSYDSFGSGTNAAFPSRYQFTGREHDATIGLQYSRARTYDSQLGRFRSEDPIGFAGGDINLYGYIRNRPTGGRDPSGLYEEDVHYYLTYYLAKRNGCFSDVAARIIAFGNQSTDDVPTTYPGYGLVGNNSNYHALNPEARPGVGSPGLYAAATRPSPSDYYFGRYLHYYQDTYSHAGYPSSVYGHLRGSHGVDKTATDMKKTLAMARGTSDEMSRYSMEKCGCKGREWDASAEAAVSSFGAVKTNFPQLADINGVIGEGVGGFIFSSPGALDRKAAALGIQR